MKASAEEKCTIHSPHTTQIYKIQHYILRVLMTMAGINDCTLLMNCNSHGSKHNHIG